MTQQAFHHLGLHVDQQGIGRESVLLPLVEEPGDPGSLVTLTGEREFLIETREEGAAHLVSALSHLDESERHDI